MNATAQLRDRDEPLDPVLLLAAIDACPESLAIVENGRILYAAQAFGKTLGGLHVSEVKGRALGDLLPQSTQYRSASEAQLNNYSGSGPMQIDALISDFQANHRALQVISIRPAVSQDKNAVPSWESQKMEAVGRLLGGVAHDFNNLLTGIMLYCDLIIAGLEVDSRLRRHAEAINKAGANGAALVQQLLTLSREEALQIQPLSWNDLISDMKSLLTRLIGENIELRTRLTEPLGNVAMDRGQVRQIILNLVLNARDAMPDGGKITLSTRNRTARLTNSKAKTASSIPSMEFSVTDTGSGMDQETLAQVFRPYFTTKARGQGNGLGLATVQNIVKEAGGEISIESEPGKGTRVTIHVPRSKIQTGRN